MAAEDRVISEVNIFSKSERNVEGCYFGTVLSHFDFIYPDTLREKISPGRPILDTTIDDDGDLKVFRRNNLLCKEGVIVIEHQNSTTLDLVGEQVWRGALFLSDYILHNEKIFKESNVLELAAGVGLTSIVASMVARKVIITDVDKGDILDLISSNLKRNQELCSANTFVKQIDFFNLNSFFELGSLKDDTTILLAADVVYNNDLTDAFLDTVHRIMKEKPNKIMYIALEKRYVFTIEDMDTVAPCYDYFIDGLKWLQSQEPDTVTWCVEQITEDFPQYFTYERTKELVLWKIKATVK